MARDLTTGWKRIGRSGPAVDGREIKPEMIEQAAANYNKELFTALIWPEHFRYINLGTVEELRTADNEEGGKDLFAKISPNQFYLQANAAGQKLFTSMELTPDFRKSGQWYLTGLGATDDPASAATTEMRLSASAKPGVFLAKSVAHEEREFNDPDKPGFFQRLVNSFLKQSNVEDEDMANKAEIETLQNQIKDLADKFAALKLPEGGKPEGEKPADDEQFKKMVDALADRLAEKFGKKDDKPSAEDEQFNKLVEKLVPVLAEKFGKKEEGKADDDEQFKKLADKLAPMLAEKFGKKDDATAEDELKALKEQFAALSKKLADALKEQPGTDGGEHFGSEDKLDEYL